jgi:acetyl esterase
MLNTVKTWIAGLLQAFKIWGLRRFYRLESAWSWRKDKSNVAHTDLQIPVGDTSIGARLYVNSLGTEKPLILYLHGGGWVIGDIETHHPVCRALAHHTGCSVISLGYRLAPEHRFPTAQDDCLAAATWIAGQGAGLAPCNGKLVVSGDSAGGNLAACICLEADAPLRATIIGQLLIYPAVDHYSSPYKSLVEKATGQMLTTSLMQWFWDTYLGDQLSTEPTVQRGFPIRAASHKGLPPTLLITAENDPLRDEGIAYSEALRAAGVAIDYRHFKDADHGFACSQGPSEDFRSFVDTVKTWLSKLQ